MKKKYLIFLTFHILTKVFLLNTFNTIQRLMNNIEIFDESSRKNKVVKIMVEKLINITLFVILFFTIYILSTFYYSVLF